MKILVSTDLKSVSVHFEEVGGTVDEFLLSFMIKPGNLAIHNPYYRQQSLSRQEGSMRHHLGSAQYWVDRPACGGIMHSHKVIFSVVSRAGLRQPD